MNLRTPKSGYYFSSVMVLLSALVFFAMNLYRNKLRKTDTTLSYTTVDSQLSSAHDHCHLSAGDDNSGGAGGHKLCTCALPPEEGSAHSAPGAPGSYGRAPQLARLAKSISFANSVDVLDERLLARGGDGLTCISEEGLLDQLDNYSYFFPGDCITSCDKVENLLMPTEQQDLLLQRPLQLAAALSASEPSRLGQLPEGVAEDWRRLPPQQLRAIDRMTTAV